MVNQYERVFIRGTLQEEKERKPEDHTEQRQNENEGHRHSSFKAISFEEMGRIDRTDTPNR